MGHTLAEMVGPPFEIRIEVSLSQRDMKKVFSKIYFIHRKDSIGKKRIKIKKVRVFLESITMSKDTMWFRVSYDLDEEDSFSYTFTFNTEQLQDGFDNMVKRLEKVRKKALS